MTEYFGGKDFYQNNAGSLTFLIAVLQFLKISMYVFCRKIFAFLLKQYMCIFLFISGMETKSNQNSQIKCFKTLFFEEYIKYK